MSSRARELGELRVAHDECIRSLNQAQDALRSTTSELNTAKSEANSVQMNLGEAKRHLDDEHAESTRLRNELKKMTQETQNLQSELHVR